MITEIDTKQRIKLVNGLLEKSFGRGSVGNCSFGWEAGDVYIDNERRLNHIGKGKPFFLHLICNPTEVGKFLNQEGSMLEVKMKYRPQARRYAELFERETGESVQIQYI